MALIGVEPRVRAARCGILGTRLASLLVISILALGASPALAGPAEPSGTVESPPNAADTTGDSAWFGEMPPPRVRVLPFAGTIALTFDDGPSTTTTMELLDRLDELHIKVTFFVTGWKVEQSPEIVREAAARGHSIQLHGYAHLPMTDRSNEVIVRDVQAAAKAIYDAIGVWPTCIRPPYGAVNDRVNQVLTGLGYRVVLWDFDSADAETQSASVVSGRISMWRAGQDVLAHDTIPLWHSVIGTAVERMRERNVGFSTICEPFAHHVTAYQPE